jgi:hypothetical protein
VRSLPEKENSMGTYGDIFVEPARVDVNTLANLGPLAPLAGIWEGRGVDVHPRADGPHTAEFDERIELQPIDPQTSGPQLLYGLRYHTHMRQPGGAGTYHDQIGYWLWEPAASTVHHTLTIPRAQVVLASGPATAESRTFECVATRGSVTNGICSNRFLDQAFETDEFRIRITVHDDGTWSYEEDTVLRIAGRADLFHHVDRNRLRRVAPPTPNLLARGA